MTRTFRYTLVAVVAAMALVRLYQLTECHSWVVAARFARREPHQPRLPENRLRRRPALRHPARHRSAGR